MLYALIVFGFAIIASFACISYCAYHVLKHIGRLQELALIECKERREYLDLAVKQAAQNDVLIKQANIAQDNMMYPEEVDQISLGIRRG